MKLETLNLNAPRLTPSFVAEALSVGAPLAADAETMLFSAVITDSRKIEPGCLFVAIKGDKFDGHDFIASALERGARGVIFQKNYPVKIPEGQPRVSLFPVVDTQDAYRLLAAAWRRHFTVPVIAVAGSVGKTTTKELLTALLQGKWQKVLKTQGSQNGFVGIPMTLLELRPDHAAAVIEVGIDEIGAMQKHIDVVTPKVALLTTICEEHLEHLRDIPTVAREEGLALSLVAKANGSVVINLDDPWIRPFAVSLRDGKKVCYSLQGTELPSKASCAEKDVLRGKMSADGLKLELSGQGFSAGFSLEMPLLGAHNALNLLGAVAVARSLGLTELELTEGLKTFRNAGGRSEVVDFPNGTRVVCDYYNANPASMEAGFELLSQLSKGTSARWACLADMLELGPNEHLLHRGLAEKLVKLGIEHVLLKGPRMRFLLEELKLRGFSGSVAHYDSHEALAQALLSGAKAGDVILIKGSRGMKMEEVWKPFKERHR